MERAENEWQVAALNANTTVAQASRRTIFKKAITSFLRLLAALSVFLVAWSLFAPHFPPPGFLDPRALALAAILVTAGVVDIARGIVPMEITYPLMLAGIVRAVLLGDPSFLLYWLALAIIYLLNVIGGGDVKLLMGLLGLFPHFEFFVVLELVVIATHLPIMLSRRLGQDHLYFDHAFVWIRVRVIELLAGEWTTQKLVRQVIAFRPTEQELSKRGDRLAIVFSFAGILYVFMMTPAGLNWRW